MSARFGRVITAMVTPFSSDGELDLAGAKALAEYLADNGSEGIVVAGTTGEAPTLSSEERLSLLRSVIGAVGKRVNVLANTGTYSTRETIRLSKAAEEAGAAGLLVVSPYYNKPPQRCLAAHFRAVAVETRLPILLYNIPGRTACTIEIDTLLELAKVPNIVGVKDAFGDLMAASRLAAETEGFEIYSGNDDWTLPLLAVGGVGAIAVASHVAGRRMDEMIRAFERQDTRGALALHQGLLPVFRALSVTTNPIPVKAALGLVGLPGGPLRAPLVEATAEEVAKIRELLLAGGVALC
ncbi:MAG: 4-hydroxy-tetrahydrodipicolinate synthase [Actinomycetota bacterium]